MNNSLECLIEGAEVCDVECIPDENKERLKGYSLSSSPCIWSSKDNNYKQSFWHLIEDILEEHDKFFLRARSREDYFIYFGFHVTDEPMSWQECQMTRDMVSLGVPTSMSAWDEYSDLTGYLWTDYDVRTPDGHNPVRTLEDIPYGKYLSLKFSITPKTRC